MAGGGYRSEGDGVYDINVTPLVDVVLVLLIIFMVTAPAIAKRGISFEEPRTASGGKIDSTLDITIDKERTIHINGKSYADDDATRAAIAAVKRDNPEVKAVITADIEVPHGNVMATVDMIKLAGISKFAFASKRLRIEDQK
jgi:biopolymer transport protein ExbD